MLFHYHQIILRQTPTHPSKTQHHHTSATTYHHNIRSHIGSRLTSTRAAAMPRGTNAGWEADVLRDLVAGWAMPKTCVSKSDTRWVYKLNRATHEYLRQDIDALITSAPGRPTLWAYACDGWSGGLRERSVVVDPLGVRTVREGGARQ